MRDGDGDFEGDGGTVGEGRDESRPYESRPYEERGEFCGVDAPGFDLPLA